MTLWISNGVVLKSSSQWQVKEFWKLNNSGHESFIFKILLIKLLKEFNNSGHELFIFKILLIAIGWNF